ncbi:regulatory protein GemA [uncultured Cohaesibacter sp.]|uniref:regulatory protein GemA n=1 Tax=uncultured Cohaesibacter sp. TaxID=1002546 RepID=UPI002AAAFDF9|nr:regulatory protein GemA [uncultured Cohaesibacter sp.]
MHIGPHFLRGNDHVDQAKGQVNRPFRLARVRRDSGATKGASRAHQQAFKTLSQTGRASNSNIGFDYAAVGTGDKVMSAIKAIHVGLKQLGINEDDARDLYEQHTGKRSLRVMTNGQHVTILGELRRMGFSKQSGKSQLQGKYAPKLQALWLSAWNLGIVRDRKDSALLAFVKRQTGIDHTRFLYYPEDARKAIEALKGWMAREAGVDWSYDRLLPDYANDDRFKVISAQAMILAKRSGGYPISASCNLLNECCEKLFAHRDYAALSPSDLIEIQKALGKQIRNGGQL